MGIYEDNIAALATVNPELATKLLKIKTNKKYEVFASGHYADANILDIEENHFMYEKRPLDEIEETYVELLNRYKLYKIMYIYGIGNGYLCHMLLQNFFHNYIYIFEPEIELIYIALNLTDLAEDIESGRVIILHTLNFNSVYFKSIVVGLAAVHFKAYDLKLNSKFYEKYLDDIKHVNKEVIKVFQYFMIATGNDATDELLGLKHFMQNLQLMLKNPTLRDLEKKGKNTDTAIIVATGPSLAKQLPLLKKIKNHVTIISVDASLPILEKEDIKPDIVTSLERIVLTSIFYNRTSRDFQKDIIFALTAIVAKELVENIKEGQFQFSMRPTGYHYRYLKLDDYGYLGLGMSAANMAYELASEMDFKQVIIIGQDLAYGKDGSSHSENHIFGTDEIKRNSKKDQFVDAYGGDGEVKTTKVWKWFLNGYETRIDQNNKEKDFLTINATEGGARIKGTTELPFEEAVKKYVDTKYIKEKIVLTPPTQDEYLKNLEQANEKIGEAIALGKDMRKTARKLLKSLTKIIRKYKKYDIDDIHLHVKEKETRRMVDKIAVIRNKYYKTDFREFYESLISPLLTHLEYDVAYWSLQIETMKKDRIHKNWKMILFHHEWASRIMINLDAILEILEPKKEDLENLILAEIEGV